MSVEAVAAVLKETAKKVLKEAGNTLKDVKIPEGSQGNKPPWGGTIRGRDIPEVKRGVMPREGGTWSGDPGNSTWSPDREKMPRNPMTNPDGKNWGQILDENDIDGIDFNDGEPDFSDVLEDTVEIDDFSQNRNENFTQADEKLAEKWNAEGRAGRNDWTPEEIRQYRQENNLTWHERSDMKTMDLVPREVHGNVPHDGGISVAKTKTSMEDN